MKERIIGIKLKYKAAIVAAISQGRVSYIKKILTLEWVKYDICFNAIAPDLCAQP